MEKSCQTSKKKIKLEPKKETVKFLLDYSASLKMVKIKEELVELNMN